MAAMAAKLTIEPRLPNATLDLILSLGYILPYIFAHMGVWILWYSLAVSSGKKRVVFSYIFGFLLIAHEIIMALGCVCVCVFRIAISFSYPFARSSVPSTGAGGFGTIVTMFPNHIIAGSLGAASFGMWAIMIGFRIYMIVQWIRWRRGHANSSSGATTGEPGYDNIDEEDDGSYRPPLLPEEEPAQPSKNPFEASAPPLGQSSDGSSTNPFDAPTPAPSNSGNPFG